MATPTRQDRLPRLKAMIEKTLHGEVKPRESSGQPTRTS